MGRTAKSVTVTSKHLTKDEKAQRESAETSLKGSGNRLVAPDYLTEEQVELFYFIIDELKESNILGNLDVFVLSQASICIDRLNKLEELINEDESYLMNNSFMSCKRQYSADFFKCCQELCLSPQSRAKISLANMNKKEDDPLSFMNND